MTKNYSPIYEAAKDFVDAGLSIIPIKPDGSKSPTLWRWKPFQTQRATDAELQQWYGVENRNGIGIVCGQISGNLEILDVDAFELYEAFCEMVEKECPNLVARLVLIKTPSPGYQLYYRCEEIGNNQKIAEKLIEDDNGKLKSDTLFETRGEGGYVLAPPSPPECHPTKTPYQLLQGDITDIPEITSEERNILLDCARSFDEKEIQKEQAQKEEAQKSNLTRPGDELNEKFSLADWHELLSNHGWKKKHNNGTTEYWQKPDKRGRGISATLNHKGSNLFYVFSTSAYPFEEKRAYTPFAAYTLLEHSNDFKAAAKALANKGYGEKLSSLKMENGKLKKLSDITKLKDDAPENEICTALMELPLTDVGNAECLSVLYQNKIRYCHTRKNWLIWNGIRWVVDGCGQTIKMAVDMVRARHQAASQSENTLLGKEVIKWAFGCESVNKINAALDMAKVIEPFTTTIEKYDSDLLLATTKNGTLDLQNGTFRQSNFEDYLTMQLGSEFISDSKAERWEQFLREVFNEDQELIDYIQMAFGYSLTGETKEQVMFLCYGSGANGKSVFLEILGYLLGDYAGAASFETFNAGNRNESGYDLAVLKGKRVVTVIETNEDRRLDEAKVKAVTGQDLVSCRYLYGNFFNYRPQFKIWMAMNHKPYITGTDNGIWRRLHLIPFTKSFKGREDKDLIIKLRNELSGILNWSLEGLRKWQEKGLIVPKAIKEATEEYRKESDSIGQWIEEKTYPVMIAKLRVGDAYKNYQEWALSRGENPFGIKKWGPSLQERGYSKGRDNDGYFYLGLELRP